MSLLHFLKKYILTHMHKNDPIQIRAINFLWLLLKSWDSTQRWEWKFCERQWIRTILGYRKGIKMLDFWHRTEMCVHKKRHSSADKDSDLTCGDKNSKL